MGDATEVAAGLPDGSRDVVIVKNLLHHLDDPAALLREAARVVRPNGRVAIVEARLGCPQFWVFTFLAPRRERYFFRGARRNRHAVEAAGMRLVAEDRFSILPYELAFHIRYGVFRRLLGTDRPATIERVSALDDRLASALPWVTSYVVWVAAPDGGVFVSLWNGKMFKARNAGGTGHNLFAVSQLPQGFVTLCCYDYWVGSL